MRIGGVTHTVTQELMITPSYMPVRAAVRLCKEEAPPGTQMYLAAIAGS